MDWRTKLKRLLGKPEDKNEKRGKTISKPLAPFEQREKVFPLSLVVTIVDRHQASYFLETYRDIGASLGMILYAYSMPPEEIIKLLGADATKKDIILTIARSEYVDEMLKKAEQRFKISKASKGIAFACPIDSVYGIAVYKFLADQNKDVRSKENGKQE